MWRSAPDRIGKPSVPVRIVDSLEAAEGKFHALALMQARTRAELDALLPAILDRAFAGAL